MAKFFRFFIILLLSNIIFLSCSFQPRELSTAEQLIETAPDSALHILQGLNPSKYRFDNNRALYGLLMIRALDKKMLPLRPDSLLDFSIAWYQKHPDPDRLASCYLYKGRTYKNYFQYEKAINCYLKALDEAKDSKDNLLLGRIHSDLGDIFSMQSDFINARKKYYTAYEYFRKTKHNINMYYSLIDIGISYCDAKQCDSALFYFRKVYHISTDSITKGSALDEIGRCFSKSEKYDSASYYLHAVLNYPYLTYNRAKRYQYLARIFYDQNIVDSAYYYAFNSFRFKPDIRTQRDCYRILTNTEFKRKHLREMSMYMNKYVQLSDSIRKIDAQIKGSYMETTHIANKEATKNKYIAWYLGALVLLILLTAYFLYRFITQRNKIEKQDTEQLHLLQKATMHKGVLVNHREVLQNKIKERKAMLASERKKASPTGKIEIDRKVYEELLHINDTEYFYDEMNSVLNNLVNKLNKLYPTLTPRELKWCCLSLLQMPSTDMYMLLDTNVDSLKKMKQRLAPKFKLTLVSELENFLFNLISE